LGITGFFALCTIVFLAPRFVSTVVSGQTAAPAGVSASDGDYAGKVGINWNAVRGATSYQVFRNSVNDTTTAVTVGTTAAPFFFDTSAIAGQQYFYWVKAVTGDGTSDFSQADGGLRESGVQQGPVPPLEPPPVPPGNTITAAKAALGKVLFWDEQMSSTRTVACGTCHRAGSGGSDPRTDFGSASAKNPGFDQIFNTADDVFGSPGVPLNSAEGLYNWSSIYGFGIQITPRKAQSYINAGYSPLLFWDGRANGTYRDPLTDSIILNTGGALESQSSGPPLNDAEMAHTGRDWNEAAADIANARPLALSPNVPAALEDWIGGRNYPQLFEEVFGTPEVTPSRISLAIGTFERTLFSDRTPLDLANGGITPLTQAEQRGRNVFNQAQCNVCHLGNLLTDNTFHNIGLRPQNEDTGRFAVTGSVNDLGEFRTPSLRNVELRAPYMHNGQFATLEDVVEFYDRGGDFRSGANFPINLIRPRELTAQQKADLVEFLKRPLTDVRVSSESGPFDRPLLYSESNRVPVVTGSGTSGSGGRLPTVTALEPPIAGNPSFTVAVANALGGASAVLVINDTDPGNTSNIPVSGSFARISLQMGGSGTGAGFGSVSLPIPDTAVYVGRTFFGRWYVADPGATGGVSVSQAFRFTVFGTAADVQDTAFDFDGDGRADIAFYRENTSEWWIKGSLGSSSKSVWGALGDRIAPADFDGDGKADLSVWRPSDGKWYVVNSATGTISVSGWGVEGDLPVPADYNGDGRADLAVFRPTEGKWYRRDSDGVIRVISWGAEGDKPVPADFDGDGKVDMTVFRPLNGKWYRIGSSDNGIAVSGWGVEGDVPLPGDYDGDGRADLAVFRPSENNWYRIHTSDNTIHIVTWGEAGDRPAPGDFDGDGRTDLAIYRPSNGSWYIFATTLGISVQPFGQAGDTPAEGAFVY